MFGEKRYLPSPYDYPSTDDYYEEACCQNLCDI